MLVSDVENNIKLINTKTCYLPKKHHNLKQIIQYVMEWWVLPGLKATKIHAATPQDLADTFLLFLAHFCTLCNCIYRNHLVSSIIVSTYFQKVIPQPLHWLLTYKHWRIQFEGSWNTDVEVSDVSKSVEHEQPTIFWYIVTVFSVAFLKDAESRAAMKEV